jgi:hypothetical protein
MLNADLLEGRREGAGRVALARTVRTIDVGDASAIAHARVGGVDDEVGDGAGAGTAVGGEPGRRAVLERLLVVTDDAAEDVLGLGTATPPRGQASGFSNRARLTYLVSPKIFELISKKKG